LDISGLFSTWKEVTSMGKDGGGESPGGGYGGGYDKTDAAKDTDSSTSSVSHAWHDARDDAAKEGGHSVPSNRHGSNDSGK